ncbi:helix-turn-helix domain-containing protein, partial [Mycolicibacterium sp.]|uniref:helix-turn-helix domain-containing protein n=1 Tax=Mycolicibacterium sp. TaxID=2320850 RepID=UPI00355E46A7
RASAALAAGCRPSVIESLVREGLIPAHRRGRDLQIRLVDLVAAGVFSAKVARMCPKLRPADAAARRNVTAEFLTFDQAARILDRPATEIRYLASIGTLRSVRFGNGAHRLHESEISGPARQRFNETARPYRPLKRVRHFGWGYTVNDAANHLGVSERTVLRMIDKGSLLAVAATKEKWRLNSRGFLNKMPVPVNHGGFLVSERSVLIARRLRQVRGELPRDDVRITVEHLRRGVAPELQAWQRFLLVDESGNRVDEYGNRVAV